jgi:glutamate--cysteine ligase
MVAGLEHRRLGLTLQQRLRGLTPDVVRGMRRGIEKESLRATPGGTLALTPHPAALGSALTHPHITTDFSESQLELITGVHAGIASCLDELTTIHQFVYREIGDELLWVGSMPCSLPADETIPIGRYGTSNIGRAKSVYRMGLGHRYGRRMQTISGIHYNWSMPGLGNDEYFGLIRNFRRHSFLLLTLFGASPALCSSFTAGREHRLQPLGEHTLHLPHATSLRMGRLGYQSDAPARQCVSSGNRAGPCEATWRELQRPGRLRGIASRGADPAIPSVRGAGRLQPRRRVQPARHQPAADRERVLRNDPAQARHPARRAAAACAA